MHKFKAKIEKSNLYLFSSIGNNIGVAKKKREIVEVTWVIGQNLKVFTYMSGV